MYFPPAACEAGEQLKELLWIVIRASRPWGVAKAGLGCRACAPHSRARPVPVPRAELVEGEDRPRGLPLAFAGSWGLRCFIASLVE